MLSDRKQPDNQPARQHRHPTELRSCIRATASAGTPAEM